MNSKEWLKITVLAAIWGSSFIFMKILAPIAGVLPTACLRILISGLVLTASFKAFGLSLEWRPNFKHYLVVGILNAALPFFLYSFAARHAPSSLSVIMNSTTPLFGAVFSLIWLNESFTLRKAFGFALGTCGVVLIALHSSHEHPAASGESGSLLTLASAVAGLIAAACYALTGIYIKKRASHVKPMLLAGTSHLLGGLTLLPFALISWFLSPDHAGMLDSRVIASLAALSLGCTAIGFMIFYHLVERIGPTQTLVVGYLIPAFGMVWSALFLGEQLDSKMVLGALLILSAVAAISTRRRPENTSTAFEDLDLKPLIENELASGTPKAKASNS